MFRGEASGGRTVAYFAHAGGRKGDGVAGRTRVGLILAWISVDGIGENIPLRWKCPGRISVRADEGARQLTGE